MGRDQHYIDEDVQPPMCGEAVFGKLRPKPREKREVNARGSLRSFDQRPLTSATSSETSVDDDPASLSPETALLTEYSRSRRSRKYPRMKNFMNPILEDSTENEDEFFNVFFMPAPPTIVNKPEELSTAECNPNNHNNLRGSPIRSEPGRATSSPVPSGPINSSPKKTTSSKEAPDHSESRETIKKVINIDTPKNRVMSKNAGALSMKDILAQQQETLKITTEQNQYYRKKLGDAQSSYRKLYKNNTHQADVINKLLQERSSFEAETLLLRAEMLAVRKQLAHFQKTLEQQPTQPSEHATTSTTEQGEESMRSETSAVSAQKKQSLSFDSVTTSAKTAEAGSLSAFRQVEEFKTIESGPSSHSLETDEFETEKYQSSDFWEAIELDTVTEKDETTSEEALTDPAENYWKTQLELSMMGQDETGDEPSNGEAIEFDMDDNNGNSFDISNITEMQSVTSVRGVDPPEVMKPALKTEPKDYEDDIQYVTMLMKKYHTDGVQNHESNEAQKRQQIGTKIEEVPSSALVEIENVLEVDRVYNKRQGEQSRFKMEQERDDHRKIQESRHYREIQETDHSHGALQSENRHVQSVPRNKFHKTPRIEVYSSRSEHSHTRSSQSTMYGDRGESPASEEKMQGAFPKLNNFFQCEARDDSPDSESRHEKSSYRSERSNGYVRDPSNNSERSNNGPVKEQSNRSELSEYGTVREHSYRSERSDYISVPGQSYGSERSDYGPGPNHSTCGRRFGFGPSPSDDESDYADHIDHSTSLHNKILWGHSVRNERTFSVRQESSGRNDRTGCSNRSEVSERGDRNGYTNDFVDGILETGRSEHTSTLATIHEPGRDGRKGGTYKITMSSPHLVQHEEINEAVVYHSGESPTHRTRTPRAQIE